MSEIIIERTRLTDKWDSELEHHRGGIFTSSVWLECVTNSESASVYLKFLHNNKPVAFLGGIEHRTGRGQNKQLFSYSGISFFTSDDIISKKCMQALYNYARENGYKRISLKSYDNHTYRFLKTKQFRELERVEYILDLQNDKDIIYKGFAAELRRRARKAKREGLVLRSSGSVEFTAVLFELLEETYRIRQSKGYGDYGYLFLPFFNRWQINKLLRSGHASFFLAERGDEVLSIQLVYTWKQRAYGLLMGTSSKGYKAGAPSFLLLEVPYILKDMGIRYLNHGGVSRSSGHMGLKKLKDSLGTTVLESAEEVTGFIGPPLNILNPILALKHFLIINKIRPWRLKRMVIKALDKIIGKRDWP